jgi:FixJ family two-component response regulator
MGLLGRLEEKVPQESCRVHVVDDDESIRRALKRLLNSMGYEAVTFDSAEDFLDSTSGLGEGCLVLDIRLPGMTGLDLQEKLASWGAKYSVIIIAANDNPQLRERAKKTGAIAYLRKPFTDQSLLDAIQSAFAKSPERREEDGDKLEDENRR